MRLAPGEAAGWICEEDTQQQHEEAQNDSFDPCGDVVRKPPVGSSGGEGAVGELRGSGGSGGGGGGNDVVLKARVLCCETGHALG